MHAYRANWYVTIDPLWPWSASTSGIVLILAAAIILIGLTVWTYRGLAPAGSWRLRIVTAIRLAALLCAILMLVRPEIVMSDDLKVPTTLLMLIDNSESMSLQDEFGNQSRWDYLHRLLDDAKTTIEELQHKFQIALVQYRFAEELGDYGPDLKPDGKRTDFGQALHSLLERHGHDRNLRGLVVLSDGADNGTRYPALAEAAPFRTLPCPIHTFAFGKPVMAEKQRDIVMTSINPLPSPVTVKGKLTVKGTVDAAGFENATVTAHLLLDDVEVKAQKFTLAKVSGNEINLGADAPATPGEIKVTLKVDPLPGEVSTSNNEISTFATVTKEGLSVLLIDRPRFPEPQRICDTLADDPRIRLYVAWLRGNRPDDSLRDLFDFSKQHYDVIIVGDISASQLTQAGPEAMMKIRELVSRKGTGFMMMGGYQSFGNSDWQRTPIADLLPVDLTGQGQSDQDWRMQPTPAGLVHYIMRLADHPDSNRALWDKLPPLNGWTKLGREKFGATVLAVRDGTDEPMLVSQDFGQGRTLAFAGDTTWQWEKYGQPDSTTGIEAHAHFWKQIVFWLARRDKAEGTVWVKPDTRRLPTGGKLGFTVGLRGKGDVEATEAQFEVKVLGPKNLSSPLVPTTRESGAERGTFWKTDVPGEYRLVVRGKGKDAEGKPIEPTEAVARFIVYQDDAEMIHRAADYEFLGKLASAGGGKFMKAEELPRFLQELPAQPMPQAKPKSEMWPDWRSAATSPFQVAFLLVFIGLLCLEWLCRRLWGWV